VVDSSPVGATAEVLELVPLADVIVVVARLGNTSITTAQHTIEVLRSLTTADMLLAVVGDASDKGNYYYYYEYGSYGADYNRTRRSPKTKKWLDALRSERSASPDSGSADEGSRRRRSRADSGPPTPMSDGLEAFTEAEQSEEVGSVLVEAEPTVPYDAADDSADVADTAEADEHDEHDARTD
jgi:hypothetical protein